MRKHGIILALSGLSVAVVALGSAALAADDGVPIWAYPVPQAMPAPAKPDDTVQKKVPGSKARFTDAGVNDRFNVPDWFPKDHPPLPDVVAHGRKPQVFACGYCHLPNGQGPPENAPLARPPGDHINE